MHCRSCPLRFSVCAYQSSPYGQTHCYRHWGGPAVEGVVNLQSTRLMLFLKIFTRCVACDESNTYCRTALFTPANNSHQGVFSIFLHSQWPSTVTVARRCSRLVSTNHIICDAAHHRGRAFCCKELKSCSSKQATRIEARASLALTVSYDLLSGLL